MSSSFSRTPTTYVAFQLTDAAVATFCGRQGVNSPFSNGVGTVATFYHPTGVATDASSSFAIVVGS
jgi:hypothetical protein